VGAAIAASRAVSAAEAGGACACRTPPVSSAASSTGARRGKWTRMVWKLSP